MSKINKSIISDLQSKTLAEKIKTSTNGVDLNYLGYNKENSDNTLIKIAEEANVNRVLFWLSSKKFDYVRESYKGGILYELLGQLCNSTNLQDWEENIKERFNEEFSMDMSLLYLKLTTDKTYKKLIVNMIIQDKLKNTTFTVATEASI